MMHAPNITMTHKANIIHTTKTYIKHNLYIMINASKTYTQPMKMKLPNYYRKATKITP